MFLLEHIRALIKKKDPTVKHINLSNQGLNDNALLELSDLFEENNNIITSVNLERNNITSDGAKTISLLKLCQLNLAQNHIGDDGVDALLKNNHLEELDLSNNAITDVGAQRILDKLTEKKNLKCVNVSGNSKISHELKEKIRCASQNIPYTPAVLPKPTFDLGNSATLANTLKDIGFYPVKEVTIATPKPSVNKGEAFADKLLQRNSTEINKMS